MQRAETLLQITACRTPVACAASSTFQVPRTFVSKITAAGAGTEASIAAR